MMSGRGSHEEVVTSGKQGYSNILTVRGRGPVPRIRAPPSSAVLRKPPVQETSWLAPTVWAFPRLYTTLHSQHILATMRAYISLVRRSGATPGPRKEHRMNTHNLVTSGDETLHPPSEARRRFLTGVVTGGLLASLLAGGAGMYVHAHPGRGGWFGADRGAVDP